MKLLFTINLLQPLQLVLFFHSGGEGKQRVGDFAHAIVQRCVDGVDVVERQARNIRRIHKVDVRKPLFQTLVDPYMFP